MATGDAASQTIQNAAGDDGIALTARGLYMLSADTLDSMSADPDDVIVAWDSISAELLPAPWTSDARAPGFGRHHLGVATYANWSWTAGGLPRWGAITATNLGAADIDLTGLIVMVAFWPFDVPAMTTIY